MKKQMLREMKNKDKRETAGVAVSFWVYILSSVKTFKNITIAKYLYSS